jgi:multiple sugar transport system ATP-binding protein
MGGPGYPHNMASVRLDHVVKRYGASSAAVTAVRDLNLEIHDKEFMVLVGPSGCGKTTALRMIAGLEEITDGEVSIDGRVVNDVEPRDRDIAMVFQNYALYPHMTVEENMAFGLKMRRAPKDVIVQRVTQTAELLGLTPFLKRKPGALSGGQRQRVALGRAIVREPKVFLMDEPLSNLDAKLRVATRAEIVKLHRRLGITTIYVTHDQVEAMTMGDRIAVMRDGILQQCDTPLVLFNKPVNMFVAGFIGTPSMNFIPATLQASDAGPVADAGEFRLPLGPKSALEDWIGREVILGARPGDIHEATPQEAASQFPAAVEVVEHMGDITTTYLRAGQQEIVANFGRDFDVAIGETISIVIDPARMHLFDPKTEQNLAMLPS